ncbi:MFS transporter [soil metagenome]
MATPAVPHDGLPEGERGLAITAILMAVAMASLDTAIVNTALPTIAHDLGADAPSAVYAITSYQLAMVSMILPFASVGDSFGHRRVYMGGVALFTAASLLCGLAWSLPTLIVARVLQGLGAAAVMSVNGALVKFIYPARMLGRGLGLNALAVGLAFTAGPTLASAILSFTTWHWLFLINVPIGIVAIVIGLRTLPDPKPSGRRVEVVPSVLCAAFFAFLVLAIGSITHQSEWGLIGIALLVSGVCLVSLIRIQRGHPAPILSVDLFKLPVFALSAVTAVCAFATQGLAFVALPFLFQMELGRSQVETGFLITPWPAMVAIMAPIAGRLSDRYPVGILGGAGLVMLSIGMGSLAFMSSTPTTFDIAWRMALSGIGFGFFQSPNLRALISSAPAGRVGSASGIVGTARLLGQTLGAALVALCLLLSPLHGPVYALWLGCGFAAVGSVMSFLRLVAK